jgi:hypothetical protein
MNKFVWMLSVLMFAGLLSACSSTERSTASTQEEGYRPSRSDLKR